MLIRFLLVLIFGTAINVLADPGGYDDSAGGYDAAAAARREAAEKTEADKRAAVEQAEQDRQLKATLKKEAPVTLKKMDEGSLCAAYGQSIRGQSIDYPLSFEGADPMVAAEIKRRKLRVNRDTVKKEQIRIGMNLCELYASWGFPDENNRSVGGWGVHIQHVYGGGNYVYSKNGIVTSWQD